MRFLTVSGFLAAAMLTLASPASALDGTRNHAQKTAAAPAPAVDETPDKFKPPAELYDFTRTEVMIPMRDGVKLHTVILIPKAAQHVGMVLTRTPYGATELTSHNPSPHLESVLEGYDNAADVIAEGGYIRVMQDVRGKYGSEGEYVMNRPLRGPLNPTATDHATDTWDTIDWLVKNVPQSNGKVAIIGISYDGFTALMALVGAHPALKAAVPMNPMVDGWMGDDWFHKGAFRQINIDYVYEQEATRSNEEKWVSTRYDLYDFFLKAGSAGAVGKAYGMEQLGFWNKLVAHPAYDRFWQDQAVDKVLAATPIRTPVLLVHSLFDQEDIYGDLAVYQALKAKEGLGDKLYLALGPWYHGGAIADGSSLGAVKFDSDTAKTFRQEVLAPFLAHYLKDEAPALDIARVTAFETGTNRWRRLERWPGPEARGGVRLYLHAGSALSFTPPQETEAPTDDYVSDPARPVTYRQRPFLPEYATDSTWDRWLADDQRFAETRSDVATYVSETLTEPVRITGEPIANIIEATTGTDADVVVKLIDVYPDETPKTPAMAGYELAVSMDVLRGRYRESLSDPKALTPNTPLAFRFALPAVNHVFLPGHKIMVQVQSSWFPLYDRNPQTFVPNIFFAKPEDYKKATITVFHSPAQASFVELPVGR